MCKLVQSFLFATLASALIGCASLAPGADPIVVRAEQAEVIAVSTFDTFLKIDDANRAMVKTNAPSLHKFAEYLREPVVVDVTNNLPRGLAFVHSLDKTKLAYKSHLVSSNAVITALATVETAMNEAQQYIAESAAQSTK